MPRCEAQWIEKGSLTPDTNEAVALVCCSAARAIAGDPMPTDHGLIQVCRQHLAKMWVSAGWEEWSLVIDYREEGIAP